MEHIRPARAEDAFRIAELFVTNYRVNFYPFFNNDEFYFSELNVMDTAAEYAEDTDALAETFVYDDGIIKGFIRIKGALIDKLFVEPQFQSGGIGAALLKYAVEKKGAEYLWALEYNKRGIAFYEKHGFTPCGEKMIEDDVVPLIKLSRTEGVRLEAVAPDSPYKNALEAINEEAFPECERVSLDELFATGKDGNLEIVGIFAGKTPVGFFVVRKFGLLRYLAYFAVDSARRGCGVGSTALRMLMKRYEGCQLVTEFEAPDESSENNEIRLRRRGFYLRSGFCETGWYSFYDDTEFELVCSEPPLDKAEFDRFVEYLHTIVSDHIPHPYRKEKYLDNIFLIGAPAVGKTTLAKELYQRLDGVYIEQNGVPEFVIPKDTADEGVFEETLCWENVLAQARFFGEKGFRNVVILDTDDVRILEIPKLFKGKRYIILRLYSSDIGQVLAQMEHRRKNEGGLYDTDLAERMNAKMIRRPLLPNEVKLDVAGKSAAQVLEEALAVIGDFEPMLDYKYDPADMDINDYCSWVHSRGLR